VRIVSGYAERDKTVAVEGMGSAEADRLLGERSSTA
jgi:hypothetical protein